MENLLARTHNPDVLTCIANLSNDEVFTPPEMASAMLDMVAEAWAADHGGEDLWANPNVTFLDPFTKTGVFLREITRRLVEGLATQIPDLQERVNHVLTKQVYGIAITELTALMTRRSVYCSKRADGEHSICTGFDTPDGNIWFERTEHTWAGGTRESRVDPLTGDEIFVYTNRKCSYCGAGKNDYDRGDELETHAYAFIHTDDIKQRINEMFGADMHFDIVIGNPPYQLSDGGGKGSSATPIYHKFIQQAKTLDPTLLTMIIPSRWFTGGKGLDSFRQEMLNDEHLMTLVDYPDSRDVFDGVDVAGGVCYFLRSTRHSGDCTITTSVRGETYTETRSLTEYTPFIRDNRAVHIVRKIERFNLPSFSSIVSARRPFDIDSSEAGDPNGDLKLYRSGGAGRYSSARLVKGHDLVNTWRVLLSKTSSEHAGQTDKSGRRRVLSRMELMEPGSVATESYLIVGPLESKEECANALSYMSTKFFRFLVSTVLLTQNITRNSFSMVPLLDFSEPWTDERLIDEFGLDSTEVSLINETIRPLEQDVD